MPIANLEPRQLIPAAVGPMLVVISNLDGAKTIYLHPEYEKPLFGYKIEHGTSLPALDWHGGRLWISASADNCEYLVLRMEPSRGAQQASAPGGGGAPPPPGGGGSGPVGGGPLGPGGGGGGGGGGMRK